MTWVFIFRLVVAGLLGTVVGIEREWRVKEAGFRTHFLVSLGSALFMIVSQWGFEEFLAYHDGLRLDPSRVAAQVVSGIGFIGAGAIIFHRQIVRGLTTAASLWAIAGVGMATGAGMYGVAAAATVLTLVGLEVLNLIFGGLGAHRTALVFSAVEREAIQEALELLRTRGYGIVSYELESERTASGIGPICCCRRARAARAMLSSSCCSRTRASWWSGSPDGECAGTVGCRNARRYEKKRSGFGNANPERLYRRRGGDASPPYADQ